MEDQPMQRISLASKVVADRTPEAVIDLAERIGYGGVEWFCMPQHLPPDTPLSRARDLAARTADRGLSTVCLSTYVGGFAESDDGECRRQLDLLDRYLEMASVFGCPVLRVWPDMMGKAVRAPVGPDVLARVAHWMGLAADRAVTTGHRVAMEMHLTVGADVSLVEAVLEAAGRPNLAVIYDPGNLHLARLPHGPDTIRRLAERIVHVQLKDASLARPTPPHLVGEPTVQFGGDFDLLTGEGEIDFVPLLEALRGVGYAGWYSVECHALPRPGLDSAAIAARELATVRGLLRAAEPALRGAP
jgi:L-ribulose-5-phosphate 3-epimerase